MRRSYCIRVLVEELKRLLASTDELSIRLDELPTRYEEYFQKTFNMKLHGLSCLEDLKDKLNGFIEVRVWARSYVDGFLGSSIWIVF